MFALSLFTIAALFATAQSGNQGSVAGTVTDATGALVAGAKLTATNSNTNLSFNAESSGDGYYRFAVLPVGSYLIKVEKNGFKTSEHKNVTVTVGAHLNLDIALTVTGKESVVTVTAETPLVETTRTSVSKTIGEETINQLPANGRNFIDYVLLTPGVTKDVRTGDISFAGQRGTLNSLTVDGADNNNTFFGQTTGRTGSGRSPYQFSEEAVQEFQVNSNGYSAEFGHAGGALINVITKSGGNKFHGSVFEFYRDRGMNAYDPIAKQNAVINGTIATLRKSDFHFNQFGGSLGGPIVKDKAFFFFNYDGQRNTQSNPVIFPATFTPNANAGIAALETQAYNYLQARSANWLRGLNDDTYLGKVDWSINSKNLLSGRYNRQSFTGLGFENGGNTNSFEHTGSSQVQSDTAVISLTSTLSNHAINVGRFQYQKDREPGLAQSINPEATVLNAGTAFLTVGRNSFSPRETTISRYQMADTFTWVHNRHTVKAGFEYLHDGIFNYFPGNFSGVYSFSSLQNFGCSLASITFGSDPRCPIPSSGVNQFVQAFAGTGTTGGTTMPNINEISFFAQDDWRVNANLTLNFGVRYDLVNPDKPSINNPAALAAGISTTALQTDKTDFAPRIGVAYTPSWGKGKQVIRGGYGIFYGRTPSIMTGTAMSNNGINVTTLTYTGANIPFYPNTICGAPADKPSCTPAAGGTSAPPIIFVFDRNFKEPMIHQANFGYEAEINSNSSITFSYLYVNGQRLQRTRDINLPSVVVGSILNNATGQSVNFDSYRSLTTGTVTRPIAGFGRILQFESQATSQYNGFTAAYRLRNWHGLQGSISYTLGKVTDSVPDATAVVPGTDDSKMVSEPTNPELDRSNGSNDQRQRFVLAGTYKLPRFSNAGDTVNNIFGGWEFGSIFTAQTGQPYSARVSGDLNGDGNSATDRVPGTVRDQFNLPANWSWDPRLTKNFTIYENLKLSVFAEAFNVLNHFNVYNVNQVQYSALSGAANGCPVAGLPCKLNALTTGTGAFQLPSNNGAVNLNGARILQLGMKFTF